MLITTDGIVLRERTVGDTGKFIDILTRDYGVIELSVRGVRKINSKSGSGTQLFAYSKFCYASTKRGYVLNSVEPIKIFYGISTDLDALTLAEYFSEVISYAVEPQKQNNEVVRLFLNSLYYLSEGRRDKKLIKSIFELRFMTETGLMPNVTACCHCGEYCDNESMYFSVQDGRLICKRCYDNETGYGLVSPAVIKAFRHIVFSDFSRLFNFRLSGSASQQLSVLSEKYILSHLGRTFRSLEFYIRYNNEDTAKIV